MWTGWVPVVTMRVMSIPRPAARVRDFAFFATFLVYAWVSIDARLIYYWQNPVFYTTPGFLQNFLKYPGGPTEYLYTLIEQAYASQGWGAVVLTVQAAVVALLTHAFFKTLAGRPLPAVRFVAAGLLLGCANLYYDHTPLAPALMLALPLAIAFVHLSRRWRNEAALFGVFAVMALAVYYLAGVAIVFLVPAAAIVQIARRPRFPLGIGYVLLAASLPVAAERLRWIHIPNSASEWFLNPDPWRSVLVWSLYALYALGAAAALWLRAKPPTPAAASALSISPRKAAGPGRASKTAPETPRSVRAWKRRLPTLLVTPAFLLALGGMAAGSHRIGSRNRSLEKLDYDFAYENWQAVIDGAKALRTRDFNPVVRYEVNLALHETNRLGDDMFRFPQAGPTLLGLREYSDLSVMVKITDMCLRLGRVNEAERYGSDALVLGRTDPRFYRLMARINMVKGQTGVARKFLNALSYNWGLGSWARDRLEELDRDPELAGDPEIQLLRRRMLRNEDMVPVWQTSGTPAADMQRLLLDQLAQDPSNRMAFEFLMGDYLLARSLDAAVALMPRIANMTGPAYTGTGGTGRMPRHYQEAMALYIGFTHNAATVDGFPVDPETIQRMKDFGTTVVRYGGANPAAMRAAWDDFHDSYFFYYAFGPGDYR
jgi:hypothetical protein